MVDKNVVGRLKAVDLFSGLTEQQLEQLASFVIVSNFSRDETVILEKDESVQALFLIASGEVKVYMSGIDGEPRSASVKAVTAAKLFILRREHFLKLLDTTPGLATGLLMEMSRRLRKANRQIGSLSTMSVYGRVAGTLLSLIEERGVRVHGDDGRMVTVIRNRPTQQQLAEMSGTTRETVSRVFSSLAKKGLVSVVGKDLVITEENLPREPDSKERESPEGGAYEAVSVRACAPVRFSAPLRGACRFLCDAVCRGQVCAYGNRAFRRRTYPERRGTRAGFRGL